MPRKKRARDEVNPDAWLAIYCDAITLLLTFFILLYSTATVDSEKFMEIAGALKGQFTGEGVISNSGQTSGDIDIIETLAKENQMDQLANEIENILNENKVNEDIKVKKDSRGVLLELDDSVLFDSGEYDLKKSGVSVLDSVYLIIDNLDNNIVIEGHTDNVEHIKGDKLSNIELSSKRAISVLRYFVEEKNMNPKLFSANGYGEYKPIAKNDTDKNRSKNRRVEILITAKEK